MDPTSILASGSAWTECLQSKQFNSWIQVGSETNNDSMPNPSSASWLQGRARRTWGTSCRQLQEENKLISLASVCQGLLVPGLIFLCCVGMSFCPPPSCPCYPVEEILHVWMGRTEVHTGPAGLQQLAPPYCSVELCVGEGSSVLGSDVAQVANREIAGSVF